MISPAANNARDDMLPPNKEIRTRPLSPAKRQRAISAREERAHLHNKKKNEREEYNYAANGHVGRCSETYF